MNERIWELVEQANLSADKTYQFDPKDGFKIQEWDKIRLEKFAKLIVRECISIVNNAERGGSNEIWDNAVKFVRRDLKEHFGVE